MILCLYNVIEVFEHFYKSNTSMNIYINKKCTERCVAFIEMFEQFNQTIMQVQNH